MLCFRNLWCSVWCMLLSLDVRTATNCFSANIVLPHRLDGNELLFWTVVHFIAVLFCNSRWKYEIYKLHCDTDVKAFSRRLKPDSCQTYQHATQHIESIMKQDVISAYPIAVFSFSSVEILMACRTSVENQEQPILVEDLHMSAICAHACNIVIRTGNMQRLMLSELEWCGEGRSRCADIPCFDLFSVLE
jgi:hypothetical protein